VHPLLYPGAEKVFLPEYPGGALAAQLHAGVFSDESPDTPDAPGRMNGLDFSDPVLQGFILGRGSFPVRLFVLVACDQAVKTLPGKRQSCPQPSERNPETAGVLDQFPVNPSFFLNA
jgi:hypothetical protein